MESKKLKWKFGTHGWIGIFLVLTFWYLNWFLDGLRTHWAFFPLWLGYCLTIDALVLNKKGSSLFSRAPKKYIGLFIISAPSWWLFELFNSHLRNWQYVGKEHFTSLEYGLYASLSFSTVIPAIFGTAEFVSSLKIFSKIKINLAIKPSTKAALLFLSSGIFLITAILKWPDLFYPFLWITIFLIIEPFNLKAGFSSLLSYTKIKDWKPIISLAAGSLICAFFWEMWNYYSYPKWIYNLPHLEAIKIFEMPLPGYVGYIPFSFELFALVSLVFGLMKLNLDDYLKLK